MSVETVLQAVETHPAGAIGTAAVGGALLRSLFAWVVTLVRGHDATTTRIIDRLTDAMTERLVGSSDHTGPIARIEERVERLGRETREGLEELGCRLEGTERAVGDLAQRTKRLETAAGA